MAKRKRNDKARKRRARRAFIIALVILGALSLFTRAMVFEPVRVQSNAMAPTYQKGDIVCALKLNAPGDIERGDIMLCSFKSAGGRLIRRVAGLPGDLIDVRDGQKYLVYMGSGGELAELSLGEAPALTYGELPESAYLALADDAGEADSRSLGLLSERDLKAEAGVILWPVSRMFRGN